MKTSLSPYLIFHGNCKEVMEFYKSIFGGELFMQTYGEAMPENTPPEHKNQIIHAHLNCGDFMFMASDDHPGAEVKVGNNVHLSFGGSDEEKLKGFFDKLSQGGKVNSPLEKQFWGDTFGMLTDKFGVHWMINISIKKD